MTDPFQVLSSERGVVRLFTTELDAEGNSAVTRENVHRLLGDGLELDPGRIEVFPSTVLDAMGLSAYLHEGYGIPQSDLRGTSAALDALKGLVIILASGAFKGQKTVLEPKPGIRFIGLFREVRTSPPVPMTPPASAEGGLSAGGEMRPLDTRRGNSWLLVLLALLAAAALVLFVAI
ncbi:MAG: hypothetical protein AAF222_15100 [Pseudomonadota bacterium]